MKRWTVLPDKSIVDNGPVSNRFLQLGISGFQEACAFVHRLPYGYNSDRDDPMILFTERMGTCTTKHAVMAILAEELDLPVAKNIGIYPMTEEIVAGCNDILSRFYLPYIPMIHCFLVSGPHRVDLTEGNRNGKKRAIDEFLYTAPVAADITAKQEYLLYRDALTHHIMLRPEMKKFKLTQVLQARELGLALLKNNLELGPGNNL